MSDQEQNKSNPTVAILAVLAIVAVGALAFVSSKIADKQTTKVGTSAEQISGAQDTGTHQPKGVELIPGNPVVAKIDGEEITRNDVAAFVRTLPPQVQQMSIEKLFPAALDQMINEKVVRIKASKVNLDANPEVQKQLADAKKEIVATVFLKDAVEKQVTDENLQNAYDAFAAEFPETQEAKASHILVEDESKANALIQQLEGGADFTTLAQENSKDLASAKNGGSIGYFAREDVVPEFATAAFEQEIGKHSFAPVKSQFGYHIIKVEERRQRPVPTLDQIKPQLEAQIKQAAMQELFKQWRTDESITVFDINGKPLDGEKAAQ